jgi:hypothetical protein
MTKKERLRQKQRRAEQDRALQAIRRNPYDKRPVTARKREDRTLTKLPITSIAEEKINQLNAIPSVNTGVGNTNKKESPKYTGDLVKGIATMHKSNAVPIINQEQATEISQMRRN